MVWDNTDLEDRTRAEDTLGDREQSLRLIIDSIPGFIITISAEGEVELVNRQFLDYVGKTFEELKGVAGEEFHPGDVPRILEAWKHSFETGQPYEIEHRLRRADGVYRWFHSRFVKKDPTHGGILEFGTELVSAADHSIVAMLGASPGASTAVWIMIQVIERCFAEKLKGWSVKLKELIPS